MQIYNMYLIHENYNFFYGIYKHFLSLVRIFFFYFYQEMHFFIKKYL